MLGEAQLVLLSMSSRLGGVLIIRYFGSYVNRSGVNLDLRHLLALRLCQWDNLLPLLANLPVLNRGYTLLDRCDKWVLLCAFSDTERFLNYIIAERVLDQTLQTVTRNQLSYVLGADFVWCKFEATLEHVRWVLLNAELWEMASECFKYRAANLFRPPCDDLSNCVVSKRVTRDLHCIPSHLFHDVLLVLKLGHTSNDNFDHAKPVPVYTEVVYLILYFLENKVKNSIESFRWPFWSLDQLLNYVSSLLVLKKFKLVVYLPWKDGKLGQRGSVWQSLHTTQAQYFRGWIILCGFPAGRNISE
jgi:hypothetical protein